jgi:adenylosuccinate synthase
MTHKVYVITDLGPGDGGKGGVIHKISTMMRVHTIIKRGGAQGSHGVSTSRGEEFAFSQWGCGTFEGIPTHLSEQMIISPEGLLNEAAHLRYLQGISNAFRLLTVDERALCATPYHGLMSRLKELARRNNPRGTVGTGAGEAYRSLQQSPELAITALDLHGSGLRDRLALIRDHVRAALEPVISSEFLPADLADRDHLVELLYDDGFLDYTVKRFNEAAGHLTIVSSEYLGEVILAKVGAAVVETSHGVLTDRLAGFHPHTSAIRTLPQLTAAMLERAGYVGKVVNLGVTRAYAVRHGAGPMPTADSAMAERLLPNSTKDANRYQGVVCVGPLDLVLLRYAIAACGGPAVFDGLAVTCFDQVRTDGVWPVCNSYSDADDPTFFTSTGDIRLDDNTGDAHLQHQAALTRKLLECTPVVTHIPLSPAASNEVAYDLCAATIRQATDIPVRLVSFGPTELDKMCK